MWRKGAAISISALTCGILSQQLVPDSFRVFSFVQTTRVNAGVYFILVVNCRELRFSIIIDLYSPYSCWWLIEACSCCIIFAMSICYLLIHPIFPMRI
ncbi:hypothetical protein T09_5443 [Trichinella sp. T9]|nr:hypothetical protein T09_5443 [Trichinella sp. T9]